MTKLKPCPFCGGKAKLVSDYFFSMGRHASEVTCTECHAWGPTSKTYPVEIQQQKAIAAWNRRVGDDNANA